MLRVPETEIGHMGDGHIERTAKNYVETNMTLPPTRGYFLELLNSDEISLPENFATTDFEPNSEAQNRGKENTNTREDMTFCSAVANQMIRNLNTSPSIPDEFVSEIAKEHGTTLPISRIAELHTADFLEELAYLLGDATDCNANAGAKHFDQDPWLYASQDIVLCEDANRNPGETIHTKSAFQPYDATSRNQTPAAGNSSNWVGYVPATVPAPAFENNQRQHTDNFVNPGSAATPAKVPSVPAWILEPGRSSLVMHPCDSLINQSSQNHTAAIHRSSDFEPSLLRRDREIHRRAGTDFETVPQPVPTVKTPVQCERETDQNSSIEPFVDHAIYNEMRELCRTFTSMQLQLIVTCRQREVFRHLENKLHRIVNLSIVSGSEVLTQCAMYNRDVALSYFHALWRTPPTSVIPEQSTPISSGAYETQTYKIYLSAATFKDLLAATQACLEVQKLHPSVVDVNVARLARPTLAYAHMSIYSSFSNHIETGARSGSSRALFN